MTEISKDINKAIQLLKEEKVIGFPTETVYGLAGNAFSEKAINSIFEIKQRPKTNPLILHVATLADLFKYTQKPDEIIIKLAEKFCPGPITFLLKKSKNVSDTITANSQKVAIRVPNHPMALQVLQNIDFPLAAPSANPFNYISPTCAKHVKNSLNNKIEFILDGGKCKKGIESTIVGIENEELIIYRPGAIALEEIKKIYPYAKLNTDLRKIAGPGMFKKHYSPQTTLIATNDVLREMNLHANKKTGLLTFSKTKKLPKAFVHIELSSSQDENEAAANLYESLYKLDKMQLDVIIVELLPEKNLGVSINDRIKKAAGNYNAADNKSISL